MKNISITLITGIITAVSLMTACTSPEVQKDVARVDSIAVMIDSAESTLQSIDIDGLAALYDTYKDHAKVIEGNFYELKTEESWPYICAYRNCKKSFQMMLETYPDFIAEIDSSRSQLELLQHDIKKKLITREETNQYILLEAENARSLNERISFRVNNALRQQLNFDTVHPRIKEFITEMQNKKAVSEK